MDKGWFETQGRHTVLDSNVQAFWSPMESYKFEKETVPITEIAQFEAQLTSYRIAPEVFKMRYFLSEMEELWESPELWKFIVATPSANSRTTDIRYREPRPDIGDFDTEKPEE